MPSLPAPRVLAPLAFVFLIVTSGCSTSRPTDGTSKADRPLDRAAMALNEARAAWPEVLSHPEDPVALQRYNDAVANVLKHWQQHGTPETWKEHTLMQWQGRAFDVHLKPSKNYETEFPVNVYEELRPASRVKLRRCKQPVGGSGIGLPIVALRERDAQLQKKLPFVPPVGLVNPATIVLEFPRSWDADKPIPVEVHMVNTRMRRELTLPGTKRPLALAWDLSAAVELGFDNHTLTHYAIRGLLNPGAFIKDAQVYRLNAYRPDQIPVIFVHGLKSDPHVWHHAINAIYSDPVLRERYQIWYFLYPTGLPIPASAAYLRASLTKVREHFDPEGDDEAMKHSVLVGHSMGGLLSRMQVIDSGDTLWDAFFRVPADRLLLSSNTKRDLTRALQFDADPNIERVLYISTPHRGSRIADWAVVRWAIRLIHLPQDLAVTLVNLSATSLSALNPVLLKFDAFGTRSVENLSPEHPFFAALNEIPMTTTFHSVVGDRGRNDSPLGGDGVVPYWSAHLDDARSEKIVPYGHSCLHTPEVVDEIRRVLHLHLNQIDGKKS
ncbi:MAG: hypothetical protein KDK99_19580, partial [Verrucomicrobiales bacterium]|nr:hypothetical protein [Verrucomicrobiales bacterium]